MFKRHPEFGKSVEGQKPASLSIPDLERCAQDWLFEGEFRSHSHKTIDNRRMFVKNLLRFLKQNEFGSCGKQELKAFFIYLSKPEPEGRWGIPRLTQPLRPVSIKDYFTNLKIMFRWCVTEGLIESSPMESLPPPMVRDSHIQPLAPEQSVALLHAAKKSCHPKRDYAIVSLLLDCGLRAGELCSLKVCDIDLNARCVSVLGKGNKRRSVFFGKATAKALWQHLRSEEREPDGWVFLSDRG
ncbi:MAG TPA: tyrosine-type recombinase/integrase, partial [Abditibacteriaceae bacterium]|nr:tyrosine-type recombinase/integrase [Abditibacteriaceae bacterium]